MEVKANLHVGWLYRHYKYISEYKLSHEHSKIGVCCFETYVECNFLHKNIYIEINNLKFHWNWLLSFAENWFLCSFGNKEFMSFELCEVGKIAHRQQRHVIRIIHCNDSKKEKHSNNCLLIIRFSTKKFPKTCHTYRKFEHFEFKNWFLPFYH